MASNNDILEDYSGDGITYGEDPTFGGDDSMFIDFGTDEYYDEYYDEGWLFSDDPVDDWGLDYTEDTPSDEGKMYGGFDSGSVSLLGDDDKFSPGPSDSELRDRDFGWEPFLDKYAPGGSGGGKKEKTWWESILGDKDMMRGAAGLLGMGLKAYQSQKSQERQDLLADRTYARKKDYDMFKEQMYRDRLAARRGGGGAPAPESKFTYKKVDNTGKFSQRS